MRADVSLVVGATFEQVRHWVRRIRGRNRLQLSFGESTARWGECRPASSQTQFLLELKDVRDCHELWDREVNLEYLFLPERGVLLHTGQASVW